MTVTFAPKGILQIDDARIIYRNFAGRASKYNREGDRNFSVIVPDQEIANDLISAGWNVKIKPPREDGDAPFIFLPVKIKFNDRGPAVYLRSGNKQTRLSEEDVSLIDDVDIARVDLDIRPYDWEVNGKNGRTAYLQSIMVEQNIDRFAARFAEEEFPEE